MLRSLYSGISGLRQHQTLMDAVSNNIANVNTTGFKSSTVVFEDTLSQLLRAPSSATAATGGTNPAQVGLGVGLAGIQTNFGQGSAQSTGRSTDLMIQGDGFFVVRNGAQDQYTRAGAFSFDSNGTLVTPEGRVVQGWTATNGVVDTNTPIGDVTLPAGTLLPPQASTSVTASGNIAAGSASTITLGATAYDDAGVAHPLAIILTADPSLPGYQVTIDDKSTEDPNAPGTYLVTGTGTVAFNPDGTPLASSASIQLTNSAAGPVTVDLSSVTNFGGPTSLAVTGTDGNTAGTLQQFQIGADGSVLGLFSNGQKKVMAQIALANFNNPMGLEKMGETSFIATTNSGLPQVGTAGSGGRGTLLGGTLEMSNVDLAQEFTNLIVAQRGFQANSRVITTSDQMLQDLVDLKR